jgi:4-amino-4-deoxy-L-arabinose transferase-like glycosyltransferase
MNRTRIVAAILFMSGVTLAALLQEWPSTPLPVVYWLPGYLVALLLAGEGVHLWTRSLGNFSNRPVRLEEPPPRPELERIRWRGRAR